MQAVWHETRGDWQLPRHSHCDRGVALLWRRPRRCWYRRRRKRTGTRQWQQQRMHVRTKSSPCLGQSLLALQLVRHPAEVWTTTQGETPAPPRRWRACSAAAPRHPGAIERCWCVPHCILNRSLQLNRGVTDRTVAWTALSPLQQEGDGHLVPVPCPGRLRTASRTHCAWLTQPTMMPPPSSQANLDAQPRQHFRRRTGRSSWIEGAATHPAASALHIANHRVLCS